MPILDLLVNAAGGGILGSAIHCVTDWLDTKNKVTLMNASVAAAEKTEAWKAFAASQGDAGTLQVPTGVWPWVSSIYVLVFALKEGTRPGLAWAGVGLLIYVFHGATPATRVVLAEEFQFGAFTAIFWYFGARYAKNK